MEKYRIIHTLEVTREHKKENVEKYMIIHILEVKVPLRTRYVQLAIQKIQLVGSEHLGFQ